MAEMAYYSIAVNIMVDRNQRERQAGARDKTPFKSTIPYPRLRPTSSN
jgi:hypothetical protein